MTKNNLIKEIGSLPDSPYTYPSPLVAFNLQIADKQIEVIIPKNELTRVKEIFQQKEYDILTYRSRQGKRVILDVGANVGLFALYMKMIYPESDIFCFEPVPSTFELLRLNTKGLTGINIFPFALFNKNKKESIRIHVDNTGANTIKMQEKYESHFGDSIQIELKEAAAVVHELGINQIDIVKIDTEGCEVEILESLQSFQPETDYVLAEYHSETDRRKIDAHLKDFKLFSSSAFLPDVGQVKYIHSKLI